MSTTTGVGAGAAAAFGDVLRCLRLLQSARWVDIDLSMAQFKTAMLVASTGGLSGRDLAALLGIGRSAVTPLVDRLLQHGYVHREEDPIDRRICWTRPTPAGMALFERVNVASAEQLDALLAKLSPDELELVERALAPLGRAAEELLAEHARERGAVAPRHAVGDPTSTVARGADAAVTR